MPRTHLHPPSTQQADDAPVHTSPDSDLPDGPDKTGKTSGADVEEALDEGLEDSFPASDPVSVVRRET